MKCILSEKTVSCIDYRSHYAKKVDIVAKYPLVVEVEYTEDEDLLHPQIKSKIENGISISLGEFNKIF